jgi:hypothetical protein
MTRRIVQRHRGSKANRSRIFYLSRGGAVSQGTRAPSQKRERRQWLGSQGDMVQRMARGQVATKFYPGGGMRANVACQWPLW